MIRSISGALAHKRSELGQKEKGFTLIELLVVVIIIGILAAIAIPIFLSQQDQAKDAAAKSDLGNAKVSYVSLLLDVPAGTTTIGDLTAYGFTPTVGATTTIPTGGTAFCIQSESETTKLFSITNSGGVVNAGC
jgi:type IV pilus assembly protein PilA